MLEILRKPDLDPSERIQPTVESYKVGFQWFDYIPCWLRFRRHFYGSTIRYTGTTGRKGFGWRVCSNCGWKRKMFLVLP